MSGLTNQAGGGGGSIDSRLDASQQAWEASMTRRLDALRSSLHGRNQAHLAALSEAQFTENELLLTYWGRVV